MWAVGVSPCIREIPCVEIQLEDVHVPGASQRRYVKLCPPSLQCNVVNINYTCTYIYYYNLDINSGSNLQCIACAVSYICPDEL